MNTSRSETRRIESFSILISLLLVLGGTICHASSPPDCVTLQSELYQLSNIGGGTYQFTGGALTCASRAEIYGDFVSRHALLIPEHVILDLGGGTISLNLSGGDSYGVRLARYSGIRNGNVNVASSSGAGSQSIFHSAISVGAAYGDGGSADKHSYFSEIGNWSIQNVQVSQPFAHSAIHLMSEAHDGLIDHVTILGSNEAVIGIGMDWGTVGSFQSDRDLLSAMYTLYGKRLTGNIPYAYTTHPHDILVQYITIGLLKFTPDPNDPSKVDSDDRAGIRASGVYNVNIQHVTIAEAGSGIVLRTGDVGNVFAWPPAQSLVNRGLKVENFTIYNARRKGVILDGFADNAASAISYAGCAHLNSTDSNRLWTPWVRFGYIRGHFTAAAVAGIYMQYVDAALIEGIDSEEFADGIRVDNAVTNSTIWRSQFLHNMNWGVHIEGGSIAPNNVAVADNSIYLNNLGPVRDFGVNTQLIRNQLTPP